MARTTLPSRLSPPYLASKYAGACFFLVALGLAAGLVWRCFFEPTRYRSQAQIAFTISPRDKADALDWDAKAAGWNGILSNPADQALLTANLRHIVKLAATQGAALETERLGPELAIFHPSRRYSAVLLDSRIPEPLAPTLEVTLDDLAANLDAQSLAAIVSDMDPPQGVARWDFSFFEAGHGGGIESNLVTRPGPEDRFFRVFYLLHELLNSGRPAASPEAARRTAAREVAARLERENEFAGGGGFGHTARRELMREITAIPALAANGLYHVFDRVENDPHADRLWPNRWTENFALASERRDAASGQLSAGMEIDLHPLRFPRDTVLTRITPLATATLLAYVSAMEKSLPPETIVISTPPVPAGTPAPEPVTAIVRVAPAAPVQVVDREAEAKREDRILALEEQLRRARLDRDAALRRLEAARETERNLTLEALSARDRSDRLGERYHEASEFAGEYAEERLTLEAARLLLDRDAVMERLANLLQTCTEEHPFVRQARRELAALDSLLADIDTSEEDARAAEAREVRLTQLRREWDRAKAAAAALDNRRRQLCEATEAALAAVTDAEDRIASTETELARVRKEPPAMTTQAAPEPAPIPEPAPEPEKVAPAAPTETVAAAPRVVFAAMPARVATLRIAPSREIPILGTFLGLCLAVLWILSRELAGGRFANANQARHMVKLPLLAALPAFDAKSFRAAAKNMRGEVFGTRPGKMIFVPMPVDFTEPKPEPRRDRVRRARRLPRIGTWAAGLLLLLLAGAAYYYSVRGIAPPRAPFSGELAIPLAEDFSLSGAEEWGNLP